MSCLGLLTALVLGLFTAVPVPVGYRRHPRHTVGYLGGPGDAKTLATVSFNLKYNPKDERGDSDDGPECTANEWYPAQDNTGDQQ